MSAAPAHEPDVQLQHHDNRVLDSPAARADDARRESVGSLIARHESVSSASSLASVDRPLSKEEGTPAPKVYAPLSLPVLALLAPASVFGVLARLGLQALATYDGESIFPLAYPQVVGCFIMGFLLPLKEPMGEFYGPLYTALTTGFCGSLTTFSGWQYDVFTSWINPGQHHRGGLRDFVDGLTKTVATLALSLGAVAFGSSLGRTVRPSRPHTLLRAPFRYGLTVLAIFIYAATLPAYFLLPASYRARATAALLFSHPGTLTRYGLSLALNPRLAALPLGTLSANALGTALLGALHVLQGRAPPVGPGVCALLQGLADGFCGCLTTVSTFAAEALALAPRRRWAYVLASWALAQALLALVLEPSFHAGGVHEQQTCHFATG